MDQWDVIIDSLKDALTWRTMIAILALAGLGLVFGLLSKLLFHLTPRVCPYCEGTEFVGVKKLSPPEQQALADGARRSGIPEDTERGYVCRGCKRVADPMILIGKEDSSTHWPRSGKIAYPPMACRICGNDYVATGGPVVDRTCRGCGAEHSWWEDEGGYRFFIARGQEGLMTGQQDNSGNPDQKLRTEEA